MAQFDVYLNTNPETSNAIPFLLDVQANLLESLSTRLVIPLVRASEMGRVMQKLNLRARVGTVEVVLSVPELAGVPASILGSKAGNLRDMRDEIIAAIDFLLTGA